MEVEREARDGEDHKVAGDGEDSRRERQSKKGKKKKATWRLVACQLA